MPQFDNRKAAQVWQRVHAAPNEPNQDAARVLALIPGLQQCAALCANRPTLATLFQRQAQILTGIHRLMTDSSSQRKPSRPDKTPVSAAALRKCYTQQLQCLEQYRLLCASSQFGEAFQGLLKLGQQAVLEILELLGG